MQIKVIGSDPLFMRGHDPEYIQPGEMLELDDARAQHLIDIRHAEAVTAKEAAKIQKQTEKEA